MVADGHCCSLFLITLLNIFLNIFSTSLPRPLSCLQTVTKSWILTVDMRAQLFRAKGYLVLKLDNRGSARQGLAFEGAVQHKMGGIEIEDQVCGVKWLVQNQLADPERVGIYGWSYGG